LNNFARTLGAAPDGARVYGVYRDAVERLAWRLYPTEGSNAAERRPRS